MLTHAPFEGPGRLEGLLVDRGYTLDLRELHRGGVVPESRALSGTWRTDRGPLQPAFRKVRLIRYAPKNG